MHFDLSSLDKHHKTHITEICAGPDLDWLLPRVPAVFTGGNIKVSQIWIA